MRRSSLETRSERKTFREDEKEFQIRIFSIIPGYPIIILFQMDMFIVEAVTLDDLERLIIGHDGKGHGAGVYFEKVSNA